METLLTKSMDKHIITLGNNSLMQGATKKESSKNANAKSAATKRMADHLCKNNLTLLTQKQTPLTQEPIPLIQEPIPLTQEPIPLILAPNQLTLKPTKLILALTQAAQLLLVIPSKEIRQPRSQQLKQPPLPQLKR